MSEVFEFEVQPSAFAELSKGDLLISLWTGFSIRVGACSNERKTLASDAISTVVAWIGAL